MRKKSGIIGAIGFGFGYMGLSNAKSSGTSANDFGVAFDGRIGYKFNRWIGFNVVGNWALCHWERTEALGKAGIAAGKWTTNAFKDVHNWMTETDERKGLYLIGWMAYPFLLMTYMAVPVLFTIAPFAATSFLSGGMTVSGHIDNEAGTIEVYAEAGIGGMIWVHPEEHKPYPAYGPLFGAGMRIGKLLGFSTRLLWSPPGTQTEIESIGSTSVYALVFTVNLTW